MYVTSRVAFAFVEADAFEDAFEADTTRDGGGLAAPALAAAAALAVLGLLDILQMSKIKKANAEAHKDLILLLCTCAVARSKTKN
jgi:hypothetical protein